MPAFEDARRIVLENIVPLGSQLVPLHDALGRAAAEDIAAAWDMPAWDNSAMDGFAIRAVDCGTLPVTLRISGYLPAGESATEGVEAGCAVKIMTGAPIPPGCDAVVPFEETEEKDDSVTLTRSVSPGQHIRLKGEDVAAGTLFLAAGRRIGPPEISMLASFGKALVPVHRRARVGIVSTGDELLELGAAPRPGAIINSNAHALAAALREIGAEPVLLGIARDNLESHREKLSAGLSCDALITSAGVSAGDRDLVRDVLAELGVEQLFWKVKMKPGHPTAFGRKGNVPVFALPGNPVSTMVAFEQFVRPALLKMMGHTRIVRPLLKAVLTEGLRKKAGRVHFVRVEVEVRNGRLHARSAGDQNTGILNTMLRADAIAMLPADRTAIAAGEEVDIQLVRERLTPYE